MSRDDREAVRFAERLLALLEEGSFSATYKFAVLLGLMDLCLEHTDRRGDPPPMVTTTQLAHKVIELYWPQTSPFDAASGLVLRQNSGRDAVILSRIHAFRHRHAPDPGCSLARARAASPREFAGLVRDVEWTLVLMPLPKVQRFGSRHDPFIYEIAWSDDIRRSTWADSRGFDNRITFTGSAAQHLVRLSPLLRPLIQQKWASMVGRLNDLEVARLEEFLFGASRVSLAPVRDRLAGLQGDRCFYCDGALRATAEVDHFLPWSRHPDDRIDNLVIAHRSCNGRKRDFLAAPGHLRRWHARLAGRDRDLEAIAADLAWPRDTAKTLGAVRGVYLRLPDGVALWRARTDFEPSRHTDLVAALTAPS